MFWIGYDIGSSSIKAALINDENGNVVDTAQYPKVEMQIRSPKSGWGEQDPESWWENLCIATQQLLKNTEVDTREIKGIGISYQMHGLVLVDKEQKILRPSIIWCDSRAVDTGEHLFEKAGTEKCERQLLNSPGNFTLSKLKWVKENEPELYKRVDKFMLPGDYIAMKLTGAITTTPSGLSEGIAWDFTKHAPADWLFAEAGIHTDLIPELVPTFSDQGSVTQQAAEQTGLTKGISVMYRAGDQPNNALALNVFKPGEIAATGGTSGVVYAISDQIRTKESTRINSFAHVNHDENAPRIGKMLCINGTGIQYSWMRNQLTDAMDYGAMNALAEEVTIGSDGLMILPFGNGAERMLRNRNLGSSMNGINFNIHQQKHLFRAALEGIAFSFVYGLQILQGDGIELTTIKAGNDNLFRSAVFSNTIATLVGKNISITETTGSVGAARAAAYAAGAFASFDEATATDKVEHVYKPLSEKKEDYQKAYDKWKECLEEKLATFK
ncbi:xylulokinase [Flavimarina sp. Hel_I_48]|uniref:xylulokinase n=1 Tax=Flavimarina sp. Hel_I_48 TaxID=1392488 RepID=UPI0004DF0432|nr:FGGY family carbohydrate kinase [Flavimarina sp. Hel_I_48]